MPETSSSSWRGSADDTIVLRDAVGRGRLIDAESGSAEGIRCAQMPLFDRGVIFRPLIF